jgi:hypothetical protein
MTDDAKARLVAIARSEREEHGCPGTFWSGIEAIDDLCLPKTSSGP